VLIDWFTIGAQIINFVILILLLRRFLYRPILNAMQERERLVAEQWEQAEQKRVEAEEERHHYQALKQKLEEQYAQAQRQVEEEVEAWRKEALQSAHQEIDLTLQSWRQSIAQEKDAFHTALRHFVIQQTYATAERALRDLANASLERHMVDVFLTQLKNQEIDLEQFRPSTDGRLTVRSAFELHEEDQERVQEELIALLGNNLVLHFESVPGLGAGIELAGQEGYRVAWNLHRYLEALQEELELQFQDTQVQQAVDLDRMEG
jgi:F-type H+-transporting ATPase subunit b